jgi:hypothetical protein
LALSAMVLDLRDDSPGFEIEEAGCEGQHVIRN